ncbi:5994_t:CDS:1 [Acaulospora colombiana]|uniref:5994_t:CDS:1 n=1 Tax=Acaulospora colombiana TaxID=27376 RepID=A0ACA9L5U2_9GLOM|nr:5994_t:CDS:1 [Acaulospora colombiana]
MHPSSQKFSFPSIPSILVIILACLTIPTCSIPIQPTSPPPQTTSSQDVYNSNDESLDGMSSSPDKMEVMNWILAAISIVIVIELIFWLFKCVNMVRRGISGNEENESINNNGSPRVFDPASNGPDDEYLPPYDGLSLPKYCEAMEMGNTVAVFTNGNGESRNSSLVEDEVNSNSSTIVASQEEEEGHGERVEGHSERVEEENESGVVEINRINNQPSTVVVEMNQVTTIDDTGRSSPIEDVFNKDGPKAQEI